MFEFTLCIFPPDNIFTWAKIQKYKIQWKFFLPCLPTMVPNTFLVTKLWCFILGCFSSLSLSPAFPLNTHTQSANIRIELKEQTRDGEIPGISNYGETISTPRPESTRKSETRGGKGCLKMLFVCSASQWLRQVGEKWGVNLERQTEYWAQLGYMLIYPRLVY